MLSLSAFFLLSFSATTIMSVTVLQNVAHGSAQMQRMSERHSSIMLHLGRGSTRQSDIQELCTLGNALPAAQSFCISVITRTPGGGDSAGPRMPTTPAPHIPNA